MLSPLIRNVHSTLSPLEVFRRMEKTARSAFFLDSVLYQPPDQSYSYLGANPFLEVTLYGGKIRVTGEESGIYPARQLNRILRRLFKKYKTSRFGNGLFTGGAVGFLAYEMAAHFEPVRFRKKTGPGTPDLCFGFYRDLIAYDHRKKIYKLVVNVSPAEKKSAVTQARFQALECYLEKGPKPVVPVRRFRVQGFKGEIPQARFEAMVRRAKEYIAAGDIYQANLSQRFSFRCDGDALDLYDALRQINPSPFASFLKAGDLRIVSSSPERLVSKRGRICQTRPIAGTRPRRKAGATTSRLARELLANEKERAEHIMLVDLERNDLGRVCRYRSVKVSEMMSLEKYSHVLHLVSKIEGELAAGKDTLDLIRAMFPGGTITGCPKIRCMEIIDELEPVRRGLYTGSIGYLGFDGDMDLNIVIRTIVIEKNKGVLQVGAGIVHDSDPAKEYEETVHKGEALAEALARAQS